MRPGGYSKASGQAASEHVSAVKERQKTIREAKRLKAEAQRRSEEAARQKGKRSKRGLDKADSDAREKIGRAVVSGKDGVAGKLSSVMDRRLTKVETELSQKIISKRYEYRVGEYGEVARSSFVAHLEATQVLQVSFRSRFPSFGCCQLNTSCLLV